MYAETLTVVLKGCMFDDGRLWAVVAARRIPSGVDVLFSQTKLGLSCQYISVVTHNRLERCTPTFRTKFCA